MVMRAGGWSAPLLDGLSCIGSGPEQIAPPDFVDVRLAKGEYAI